MKHYEAFISRTIFEVFCFCCSLVVGTVRYVVASCRAIENVRTELLTSINQDEAETSPRH